MGSKKLTRLSTIELRVSFTTNYVDFKFLIEFFFSRTSNQEEIAIRLATRRAEQKLRQEEHELNMEMMKQRVKTAPLLLEGPTQLSPRLGHIYHHCDMADDKKKVNNYSAQQNGHNHKSHHHKSHRPESTISTDSKLTESSIN